MYVLVELARGSLEHVLLGSTLYGQSCYYYYYYYYLSS